VLPVVGSEALAGGAAGPVVLAVNGMVEDARKEMGFFFLDLDLARERCGCLRSGRSYGGGGGGSEAPIPRGTPSIALP
jgi:hypothetical protein